MNLVTIEDVRRVRVLTFAHEKPTNPFNKQMKTAVTDALRDAEADDAISSVVLTGGYDRSFSAGGDFNEVRALSTPEEVDAWIDRITDFYLALLSVTKPTVAAIDNHAIGIGFQIAVMLDWRVMSTRASLMMPELEHGIGASMASAILTTTCGYDRARHLVMSCQPLSPAGALGAGIVDEVTEREFLLERAVQRAERLGSYPRGAFSMTKKALTAPLRDVLEQTREQSKAVHRAAFGARAMHAHFDRVLDRPSVAAGHA